MKDLRNGEAMGQICHVERRLKEIEKVRESGAPLVWECGYGECCCEGCPVVV